MVTISISAEMDSYSKRFLYNENLMNPQKIAKNCTGLSIEFRNSHITLKVPFKENETNVRIHRVLANSMS